MFGIFKKKQPTALDGVIRAIYGDHPPKKTADLDRAVTIAHEDILCDLVTLAEVRDVARGLLASPIPYSTHDLAVAVALSFFKKPEHFNSLKDVQLAARLRVLNWMKDGKVARGVTNIFEDALYTTFKPGMPQPDPPPIPQDTASDEEAKFAVFKERNVDRSLDEATEIVREFMLCQHSFASGEMPDDWVDEHQDHADRILRAFLLGAVRMAAEAFSFSQVDEGMLLMNILGEFYDLDGEEETLEIERTFEASDVEEEATRVGGAAIIDYLLNEPEDENLPQLAALQKICWKSNIVNHAVETQKQLQEEFAALGINFMQLHPLIHGSVLREATFAGVPLALQHFHEYSQHVAGLDTTDDEKAEALLAIYRLYKPSAEVALAPPPVPPEPSAEYTGDLSDAVRFTEAAKQWFEAGQLMGGFEAACKARSIEAEHTDAVNAILKVDLCIMRLMKVRDYDAMLGEEEKLSVATRDLMEAMEQFSEAAHDRNLDVSATAAIIKLLAEVLKARGMVK